MDCLGDDEPMIMYDNLEDSDYDSVLQLNWVHFLHHQLQHFDDEKFVEDFPTNDAVAAEIQIPITLLYLLD